MRIAYRILIALEVLVCFTPMTLVWLLGAVMSPFVLAAFIAGPTLSEAALGGLWFFGSVAGGACGLIALSKLLARLLGHRRPFRRPAWVLAGLALGALPILPFALTSSLSDGGSFLTIAPLAATAHLVYLGRGLLFPRHDRAESREPAATGVG